MDIDDLNEPEFKEYQPGEPCPECFDGIIVRRYGRKFENREEFLGCSNWPYCEFKQNYENP